MGDLEDSVQRHPAGNAKKETIWDTAWAISKAMQIGREQEQERIINLLDKELNFMRPAVLRKHWIIALIKADNK